MYVSSNDALVSYRSEYQTFKLMMLFILSIPGLHVCRLPRVAIVLIMISYLPLLNHVHRDPYLPD